MLVLLVVIVASSKHSLGQDSLVVSKPKGNNVVWLAETGLTAGSLALLTKVWYTEPKNEFHAFNDANEWLQMDKVGHGVASYQILRINSQLLEWSGIEQHKAVSKSFWLGMGYMTAIEVLDGFSPTYGASFTDLGANYAGALLYLLQYKTNSLDCFTLKYGFKTSGLAGYRPNLLGKSYAEQWLKDYNGQTYWLSLGLNRLTGVKVIPDWLNLALGYGAGGMLGGKANPMVNEQGLVLPELKREREYFLSLDINTEKIFKRKRNVNRAFRLVSFIKIPLPGVKFTGNGRVNWQWLAG